MDAILIPKNELRKYSHKEINFLFFLDYNSNIKILGLLKSITDARQLPSALNSFFENTFFSFLELKEFNTLFFYVDNQFIPIGEIKMGERSKKKIKINKSKGIFLYYICYNEKDLRILHRFNYQQQIIRLYKKNEFTML